MSGKDELSNAAAWAALAIQKTGPINSDCANAIRGRDAQGMKVYLKSALSGAQDMQQMLTRALVHIELSEAKP